jgi:telomerase reverse transcriptase
VSAFCQAVLAKIIPNGFFGGDSVQTHNRNVFLKKIDHFVRMRRFEQLSLHEVIQDLKVIIVQYPDHVSSEHLADLETDHGN